MSDTESLEYLQTGFDPTSLTVPRLRSILVYHNVDYPSSAKKAQLVQLLVDKVLPQSRKILAERARARRTSKGITNAGTRESTVDEDEDMTPEPTPRARTRKSSARLRTDESESDAPSTRTRKSSARLRTDESESDAPSMRTPAKRAVRGSTKHVLTSDTEAGAEPDLANKRGRRMPKSESRTPTPTLPTPIIKSEYIDDDAGVSRRESAFTYDNPFQSGSSPQTDRRTSSGERRRKSGSVPMSARKSSGGAIRRRTDVPKVDDGIHPPTAATFEMPAREFLGLKDTYDNEIDATEEFTPQAQLELDQERAARGVDDLGPARPKKQQARGFNKSVPIWLGLLTIFCGYATWYRQEKVAVGYCGVGRHQPQVFPEGVEVPDWIRILAEPECELCPQHAYCSENFETHCESDFVLKPHPLSLGGIIPLVPTCEPDGEKVRRVKAVADRAVEELRERRAKWECGDLTDTSGLPEPTVEIDAVELKKEVSKKRRKGMGEAEFEDLWAHAIGEIEGRDEVVSHVDGARKLLTSTSLARLPLSCSIRRSFRLALARHRLQIATVVLALCSILYVRHFIRSRAAENALVPQLVSLTLDRLATQATLHAQDRETFPESWISIGQLRDDVLRDQHSLWKREALWNKVKKVVEMNANVRAAQRESRSGEISRVWEWIGTIGGLESGEKRRKSGRVSWGVYDSRSSPVSGTDAGPELVQSKWEEGRPIY